MDRRPVYMEECMNKVEKKIRQGIYGKTFPQKPIPDICKIRVLQNKRLKQEKEYAGTEAEGRGYGPLPTSKIFIAVSGQTLNLPELKIKSLQLQAVNPAMEKYDIL